MVYVSQITINLNVYDQYDERFEIGKEYNLFLLKKDLVLYPHTVYTSVVKNAVFNVDDIEVEYGYADRQYILISQEIPSIVSELKQNRAIDISTLDKSFIQKSETFTEAVGAAEIIAEVKLLSEYKENPYVSMYEIEVLNVLQGSIATIATKQLLQPNLTLNESYYLLLKQTEDGNGYSIFDPTYSVTRKTNTSSIEMKLAIE